MSKNICTYCKDSSKETECLVLHGGSIWIDYCQECGEKETLTNSKTNEVLTISDIAKAVPTDTLDGVHA